MTFTRNATYGTGGKIETARPLTDPAWEEAATDNARKGFPWHTWGMRTDVAGSMGLLASHATEAQAEAFAQKERVQLRPKGAHIVIVQHA